MPSDNEIEALKARLAALEGSRQPVLPPAKRESPLGGCLFMGVGLAVVIFVVVRLAAGLPEPQLTPEQQAERAAAMQAARCSDTGTAYMMAQEAVSARLRAPSTARFPGMFRDGVSVRRTGECGFVVTGYVDAQNGFGAQIRSQFIVTLRGPTGDEDTWAVEAANIW